MPRRVDLVVLCEDALHRSFVTAFLNSVQGLSKRRPADVRIKGSRSQVLKAVPSELKAVRTRGDDAHLLVLVDLDTTSIQAIEGQIAELVKDAGEPDIAPSDPFLLIGAKREVDTWIEFLGGKSVDEERKFSVSKDDAGRNGGRELARRCTGEEPLSNPPSSLTLACDRWQAYLMRNGM